MIKDISLDTLNESFMDTMESNGNKTDYYNINTTDVDYIDVDDIAEHLYLHGFLFNVLKSVFGCAIDAKTGNSRHSGTSALRDANKMVHYAAKYRDMLEKQNKVN